MALDSTSSHSYDLSCSRRSVGASHDAPRGGIRQHKQVETGEILQGERHHQQESQPIDTFDLGFLF